MARRALFALLLAALAAWAALPAAAAVSDRADGELVIADADVADFPEVRLTVTAPVAHAGRDLPADAFRVTVDGARRQHSIATLPSQARALDVVLLVDTSGSMRAGSAMQAAIEAAAGFVRRLPADARVAVVAFDSATEVVSGFDAGRDAAVGALSALEAAGDTALYDGVLTALDVLAEQARPEARETVVLLSDGGDTESTATLDAVRERLAASGGVLHAVELATPETDRAALQQLAAAGGGSLTSTARPEELAALYAQLAAALANQYELVFTAAAGGPASIGVQLAFADRVDAASARVELPALPTGTGGAAAPEPAPVTPREGEVVGTPLFGAAWVAYAGAAVAAAGLGVLLLVLLLPAERRARLPLRRQDHASRAGHTMHRLSERAVAVAERQLSQRQLDRGLNATLERAGLDLRAGEWVVLVALAALGLGVIGLLVGPIAGLALAGAAVLASRVVVGVLQKRRQRHFQEVLADILQLMAGSLRAGHGLLQAVDSVAQEADEPAAGEFRRVVVESRLGRDLTESLEAVARRTGSEDFAWVVQAIAINREVGGDLAEILDTVAQTVRERQQLRRQVKALSAEGRLSGAILLGLPFGVGALVWATTPDYVSELTTSPVGWGMLMVGAVLMIIGTVWMRRVVKVEF